MQTHQAGNLSCGTHGRPGSKIDQHGSMGQPRFAIIAVDTDSQSAPKKFSCWQKRELGSPPSDGRKKSTANRNEWSTQYLTAWQRAIPRQGRRGQGGGQHWPEPKCLRGHFQHESHRFPTVRKPCLKIPKACGQPVFDQTCVFTPSLKTTCRRAARLD